jgi:hypothetical protein
MPITRRQLRRDILKNLGDLRILRATSDGTDVTFYDAVSLVGEVDAYKGREILFTGGTAANLGETRTVFSSSSSNRALFFSIVLPAATVTGDEAELANFRGTGYRFQDVHDAINEAIRTAGDRALANTGVDQSAYARGSEIAIPSEFRTVETVQFQPAQSDGCWRSIPKASRPNGYGWWVDRAARTLQITGRYAWIADGATVKVWGLAEPPELFDDNDETSVDQEWLKFAALSQLLRARSLRMTTPENDRLMYMLSQKADQLRSRLIVRRGPFSEAI